MCVSEINASLPSVLSHSQRRLEPVVVTRLNVASQVVARQRVRPREPYPRVADDIGRRATMARKH